MFIKKVFWKVNFLPILCSFRTNDSRCRLTFLTSLRSSPSPSLPIPSPHPPPTLSPLTCLLTMHVTLATTASQRRSAPTATKPVPPRVLSPSQQPSKSYPPQSPQPLTQPPSPPNLHQLPSQPRLLLVAVMARSVLGGPMAMTGLSKISSLPKSLRVVLCVCSFIKNSHLLSFQYLFVEPVETRWDGCPWFGIRTYALGNQTNC